MTKPDALPGAIHSFRSTSGSLFNGYFTTGEERKYTKDSLVDGRARRIFDLMSLACERGVYPYQMPLEGRTGPHVQVEGQSMLMLSSYDYLGLIGDARVDEAAIEAIRKYGTGSGGARMLTGTADIHHLMEEELAAFKGMPKAVTFSSGYLANLAIVAGLLSPQDRVIMDALCHRSLVDSCRMAGVQLQRFKHNDPDSLRYELGQRSDANRTLIISDGVFSMDGDICCLPELIEIRNEFRCFLMVDDAHAIGVIGKHGRGSDEHFGIPAAEVDIWTGSFAKAVASNGGFAAVSQEVALYVQHAASPFIFSAALSPSATAAVRACLAIIDEEPERIERVCCNGVYLREGLRRMGYDVGLSETAIIPVVLYEEAATTLFAAALRERGIIATPVMFPAVPMGSARLRLCVTAAHTREDLDFVLKVFRELKN